MQTQFNNDTVYTVFNSTKSIVNDILDKVPYMDSNNITDMICNQYVDKELIFSKPFLELFLEQIAYIFDRSIYLNRELDTLYIPNVPESVKNPKYDNFIERIKAYILTDNCLYIEQYFYFQFNLFLTFISEEIGQNKNKKWNEIYTTFQTNEKYKQTILFFERHPEMNITSWTDFFQVKIQQPILLINPSLLNDDSRSTRSTGFLAFSDKQDKRDYNTQIINYKKNSQPNFNSDTMSFKYEIGKHIQPNFDIYCQNGFTILEYLIHILTIRGNPLDRWYTLYSGITNINEFKKEDTRSYKNVIKFEQKYAQLVQSGEIKDDFITIYFLFGHGS